MNKTVNIANYINKDAEIVKPAKRNPNVLNETLKPVSLNLLIV